MNKKNNSIDTHDSFLSYVLAKTKIDQLVLILKNIWMMLTEILPIRTWNDFFIQIYENLFVIRDIRKEAPVQV